MAPRTAELRPRKVSDKDPRDTGTGPPRKSGPVAFGRARRALRGLRVSAPRTPASPSYKRKTDFVHPKPQPDGTSKRLPQTNRPPDRGRVQSPSRERCALLGKADGEEGPGSSTRAQKTNAAAQRLQTRHAGTARWPLSNATVPETEVPQGPEIQAPKVEILTENNYPKADTNSTKLGAKLELQGPYPKSPSPSLKSPGGLGYRPPKLKF